MRILLLLAALLSTNPWARADQHDTLFQTRILPILNETCFQCHGALKTSGLDLRERVSMMKGGAHGFDVVPGNAEKSRLYRLVAGLDKPQMPPARKLGPAQIAAVKAWIDAGARWATIKASDSRPWPFNKPIRPMVPRVRDSAWVRNPIDAFILSKLESKGFRPAAPASKATLVRRAYLDLTGLPPTPVEVDSFLKDATPNAYPKLIDRLLNSPHYGERWARHWLDLARYAESEGFKTDEMRPNAWRYRDYVIQALNSDKPYDRFIQEQIAGDEMYPDSPDALVATGFCRHFADESNARNLRLRRQEILNDITDTVGSTVLGLTMGCARCHNHKYDPIPQRDYYRLQAYFAAVRTRDDLNLTAPDKRTEYDKRLADWDEKTREVRSQMAALEAPARKKHFQTLYAKFPVEVQEAVDTSAEKRSPIQWLLFRKAEYQLNASENDIAAGLKGNEKAQWTDLRFKLDKLKALNPGPAPTGIGISDIGPEAPKTFTLATGVYDHPLEEVQPGPLSVCGDPGPSSMVHGPSSTSSTGRRTELVRWLTSPDNPLTARVAVNRLWHYHFGRGIVPTTSDFGNAGERPSHRELLDWLSVEFVSRGWSLKQMHRVIMTSSTYMQSTAYQSTAARVDPDNSFLWRVRRRRLEGEAIRDSILAVSGELNPKMGGPSVMPDLPQGLTTRGYWKETPDRSERLRRSVYVFVKRNLRYPFFEVFDMPDTHEPCSRREITTTAPQALTLLNNDLVLRSAQAFAGRVINEAGIDTESEVTYAYRLALCRAPSPDEIRLGVRFLERQAKLIDEESDPDSPLLLPIPRPNSLLDSRAAALVDLCHALLNSNEFIYVE